MRTTLSVSAAHIATVRAALKALGRPPLALAALDALAARIDTLEAENHELRQDLHATEMVAKAEHALFKAAEASEQHWVLYSQDVERRLAVAVRERDLRAAVAALADAKKTEA
jgi:hypothetical protein